MKFKSCEWALSHLVINSKDINYCCASFDKRLTYLEEYDGHLIDIDDYLKRRSDYIEMCKKGDYPEACKECPSLEERNWDEAPGFDDISVSNRTKCSCNCIYCIISGGGKTDIKSELNTRPVWDIKPVLEDLRSKNMIKPGCHFIIGGGECAEYPDGELEWLIYFSLAVDGYIELLSAGIVYSKAIEKVLATGHSQLKVSVDAGTKETYEKVKRVKGYDRVWDNLKNYIKAAKQNPEANVVIKYVIIPGVNDNLKDAKTFIKKCSAIGCESIEINMEFFWMSENHDKPISKELKQTLEYFNNFTNKNLVFSSNINSHIKDWLKQNLN